MVFQIFQIIFPIIFISGIGYLYAKYRDINMEMTNKINLEIFIPIMIFYYLSQKLPSLSDITTFSLGGIIVVFGSALIAYPVARYFGLNIRTFLPPMMFNNSINLGLPLILFAFGQTAMSLMISLSIIQVIGQFTVGVAMYGGKFKYINIIKNPVIIATIFGLLFNHFDIEIPKLILTPLEMMSYVVIPLVLFALGVRLTHIELKHWKIGLIGAILCPISGLVMAYVANYIFDYTSMQQALLFIFAILPPAVLNAIMAEQYKNDATMVASVVALGNLFSLITIPLVLYFFL